MSLRGVTKERRGSLAKLNPINSPAYQGGVSRSDEVVFKLLRHYHQIEKLIHLILLR